MMRRRQVEVWVDEEGRQVNFNAPQVESISAAVFRAIGLTKNTDHSYRAAFASWSSRLHASLPETLEIGEWSGFNSTEWYRYFENGLRKRNLRLESNDGIDPLAEMFPWPVLGMNPTALKINPFDEWMSPVSGES